jgi:hypothetical protein
MVAEGRCRARHGMNGARVGKPFTDDTQRGADRRFAFRKVEPRAARPESIPHPDQPLGGQCCVSNEVHNGCAANDPQPCLAFNHQAFLDQGGHSSPGGGT